MARIDSIRISLHHFRPDTRMGPPEPGFPGGPHVSRYTSRASALGGWFVETIAARGPTGPYLRHSWSPGVDVYETLEAFILVAELAGVGPDDVSIELEADQRTLHLRGFRSSRPAAARSHSEAGRAGRIAPHQVEIASGTFERSVVLPGPADAAGAEARGRHGLYEVWLPKATPPPARQLRVIDVQATAPEAGSRSESLHTPHTEIER